MMDELRAKFDRSWLRKQTRFRAMGHVGPGRPDPRCRGKIVDIVPRAREALRASGGIGLVSLIREEGESL